MPPPPPAAPPKPATTPKGRVIQPRQVQKIVPRLILAAQPGFGKTSALAYAPKPLILMAPLETSYDTLLAGRRVPQVPAEIVKDWPDLLGWLAHVEANPSEVQTLGIDAMGGFEKLCWDFVCARDFNNNWSKRAGGFNDYATGPKVAAVEWASMLARLERIHELGITVALMSHIKTEDATNPQGDNFQRWTADVDKNTWSVSHKWADTILFGLFFVDVKDGNDRKAGKAKGGSERHIYTGESAVMPCKNKSGMDSMIVMPADPSLSWTTILDQIVKAKD